MRILREFPEKFHTGPCTDAEHAGRCIESQSTLAHAPRFSRVRVHWPMLRDSRDSEHTGRCTEFQSTLADALRLRARWPMHRDSRDSEHTGLAQPARAFAPPGGVKAPAHAATLRARWPMHRDSEHIGPCTETQSTLTGA